MKTPIWFSAVSLLSFVVYYLCMTPSVSFTDAGELAGACYTLGVAHPTGYPLFVILGYVWSHIPLTMTVIAKMNLFAAFCTALSVGFVFLLCREVLGIISRAPKTSLASDLVSAQSRKRSKGAAKQAAKNTTSARQKMEGLDVSVDTQVTEPDASSTGGFGLIDIIAAATALSYAFAQTVWLQALSIEVYSLHLTCISATLWMSMRAVTTQRASDLAITALLLGLSFTNHLTTILICVPVVVLHFYRPLHGWSFSAARRKEFLFMLGITASCSLIYGTLALNSMNSPWFNWGAVHRGWEQFSYHVLGKQYSVWMFSDEEGVAAKQFAVFRSLLGSNTAYIGMLIATVGAAFLILRSSLRPLALFFIALIVCGVGYSINYSIHDIDTYFLSAYMSIILLSGVGLYLLFQRRPALALSSLLVPIILLSMNWKKCDQHENVLVREYVKMMVDPLPNNAVLISQQWDYFCSAFWYMQQVEGYRPDVVMVEKELLRRTWYPGQLERWYPWAIQTSHAEIDNYMTDLRDFEQDGEAFQQDQTKVRAIQSKFVAMLNSFVLKNLDQRPIFATQEVFQGETGFAQSLVVQPYGMCLRIARDSSLMEIDTNRLNVREFALAARKHHEHHLEKGIASVATTQLLNVVPSLAMKQRSAEAAWYCRQALLIDPANSTAQQYLNRLKSMQ